jgi:hypothetical protein
MYWDIELDDQSLQDLYAWIDQIPLSRPKKHIDKDFADGGMYTLRSISLIIIDIKFSYGCGINKTLFS